jgi:hypothetical protein
MCGKIFKKIYGDYMKKIKFFNKGVEKRCEYCIHSREYAVEGEILCEYKGVVDSFGKCRKYKYDILKRKPIKIRQSDNYSPEDFVI